MPSKYGRMIYVCGITHKNCDLGGFCGNCQIAKEYEVARGWEDSLPRKEKKCSVCKYFDECVDGEQGFNLCDRFEFDDSWC